MKRMTRTFYVVGLFVVTVMAAALYLQYRQSEMLLEDGTRQLSLKTRDLVASDISGRLESNAQVINAAADYVSLASAKDTQLLAYMAQLMKSNKFLASLYFGTPENKMVNASGWKSPAGFDLRNRPWYKKAAGRDNLVYTEVFFNASRDSMIVTIAKAVRAGDGTLLGVIGGDVRITSILEMVKRYQTQNSGYCFLLDANGGLLAHPKHSYDQKQGPVNIGSISPQLAKLLSGPRAGIAHITLEGEDGYLAYRPVMGTDWTICTFIPLRDYLKSDRQLEEGFILTLLTVLLLLAALFRIEKRYIVDPMVRLDRDIRGIDMENDRFFRLSVAGKEPLTLLRSSINSLLERAEKYFQQLQCDEEELEASNQQLAAAMQQLSAAEAELRDQYDSLIDSKEMLRKSEEHHRAIVEAMPDLIFVLDGAGIFIGYEAHDRGTLYVSPKAFLGKSLTQVLPLDIAREGYESLALALATGEMQTLEYELLIAGARHFYELRIVKSSEHEAIAISRDITAAKLSGRDLEASEHKYRSLVTCMQQGLALHEVIFDKAGSVIDYRYLEVNESFEQIRGVRRDKLIGRTVLELFPETKKSWIEKYGYVAMTGEPIFSEDYLATTDKYYDVIAYCPQHKQFAVIVTDITERKRMEAELKQEKDRIEFLSYHDHLTGLYNRRFFEEELNRLDVPRNLPLTIVMADVNGLKLTNDAFGHAAGDELLQKVAAVIKGECRADDIIARLGGDEFVMLLPQTEVAEAAIIVKRIKDATKSENVNSIVLSISFGLEAKRDPEEDIRDIFKQAEDHMYKEKMFESPSMRGKTVGVIIKTLHEKNKREEQHSHRVSDICTMLAEAAGLPDTQIQELKTTGLLHDIGKIAIEESILNKPGKLTEHEWEEMKRHPEIGYRILGSVDDMSDMAGYVLAHHERWDGQGYPRGLKGEEIPIQARIITIADAYDAMTSERAYRGAMSTEKVMAELRNNAGSQFDPALLAIFLGIVENKLQ